MDHHAAGLDVGDKVVVGQVIGAVGNTGTSGATTNTNYHLHFEYRPGDVPKNSYALLQRDPNVTFA
jgi:peptidoglycan LD-endopeptidase LytH